MLQQDFGLERFQNIRVKGGQSELDGRTSPCPEVILSGWQRVVVFARNKMPCCEKGVRRSWIWWQICMSNIIKLEIHTANEGLVRIHINVWFLFIYSQKWNCAASLFPKHHNNFLSPNFHIHISVHERLIYSQDRSAYLAARLQEWQDGIKGCQVVRMS